MRDAESLRSCDATPPAVASAMPAGELLNVLIATDDPTTIAGLHHPLEREGHRFTAARTEAEARARIAPSCFDVIVLDRRLPGGESLLADLPRLAPGSAVLLISGPLDFDTACEQGPHGCSECLLWPRNADRLRCRLARIADQHRLARARESSDVAFRQLLEAAECVSLILREGGENLYISPFGERLTGYDQATLRGRNCIELLAPSAFHAPIERENRQILAGRPTQGFECPLRCGDGSLRAMIWNARLLPDYEGGPAVMTVGQDISVVKEAQERALQAERLAAIGEMVDGLAHESRNALQRIQACLEMLMLRVLDHPEALALIGRIQTAQDDLNRLFEDVRAYAAPIPIVGESCRLDRLWRNAWAQLELSRRGKAAHLTEVCNGIHLTCVADPFRLEQVFRNVFENALAACEAPVEIVVRADESHIDDRPAIQLTILDNGPGIQPDLRARAFEPFFTTKTHGTGLGLSIAKRIVEAHGGWIRLGESPATGARFLITIPRDPP
jgi:PAS domain S-box-containing protein